MAANSDSKVPVTPSKAFLTDLLKVVSKHFDVTINIVVPPSQDLEPLTERQKMYHDLVKSGMSNRAACEAMKISEERGRNIKHLIASKGYSV